MRKVKLLFLSMIKSIITLSLFLISSNILQAQISQAEYEQLQKVNMGNDKTKAGEMLTAMEKKYANDPGVIFQRGYYNYYFEQDYNKALVNFSSAIKLQPDFLMAYLMRSRVFSEKGIFSKAIDDINVVLKINPDEPDLLVERASWYFSLQQYDLALNDFLKLTKLTPSVSSNYFDAANAYKKLGKNSEAEQILKSAFNQNLDSKLTMHNFYGRFLIGENRFKEAMEQYKKAIAISSENWKPEEYNDAGIAFYRSDDLANADKFFEKAMRAQPDNIDYVLNRADVAVDGKDWTKVMSIAKSALALDAKHPKANMMMAVGLTRSGDAVNGKVYADKAKQYAAEANQ